MSVVAVTIGLTLSGVAAQDIAEASEATPSMEPMTHMEPGLHVEDAWARASMMADLPAAVYVTIHNSTDTDDALVGASTPAAAVVELHHSSDDGEGAMGMLPVDRIPIPAHGDAGIEPGGYHIMLIDLVEPLAEGDAVELSLEFATADPQTITVAVQSMAPVGEMDGHDMDHGDMDHGQVDDAEPELTWAPLVTPPAIATPSVPTPVDLADGFALGHPDAAVTVEVWEDFQCPFCQRSTFEVEPRIVERYVKSGDVRLVFRNLAFLGDESHWAAVAASLAADQDKFWPFHDYLFANLRGENRGSYSLDRLLEMGQAVDLDMDAFRTGLQLENARQRFARIQAEAQAEAAALGISATPTVTVNGVPLQDRDFDAVAAAIDEALAVAAPSAAEPNDG
jgi:copper(I)-binding protein/protein-disulfide isomerase